MISLMLYIHLNFKFMIFPQFCLPSSCLSPTLLLSPVLLPPILFSHHHLTSSFSLFLPLALAPLLTLTFSIPLKQHHEHLPALSTLLNSTLLFSTSLLHCHNITYIFLPSLLYSTLLYSSLLPRSLLHCNNIINIFLPSLLL